MTDALRSYSLEGKTAFVTGAAGGIGSAITERLCGLGARVILADIVDRVQTAAKEWASKGYKTSALKLDVTNSAAVEQVAADLNKQFGHVDILVANAGVAYESPTETHSDDDWHRCLKINLDGVFYCVRSFGRRMVERKSGSIVCISSIAGVKAVRPELHAGYDVSKAGVAHLCRVVGVEWATHNVRVNAVGPGYTETDMLKKGATGSKEEKGKPETFDFLGFTHISGKNRKGTYTVRRMTIRKRMRAKLQQIKLQLRKRMHDPVAQTGAWLRSVVQGYFNYYAVPGNFDSLNAFRTQVSRFWHWTLLRRSQKRQFNWVKMRKQIEYWIPKPRVLHPYPETRFTATHPR